MSSPSPYGGSSPDPQPSPSPSPSPNEQSSPTSFTGTSSNMGTSTGTFSAVYNHTHGWTIDENGDGVTGPGGGNSHTHQISNYQFSEEVTNYQGYPDITHKHNPVPRATTEVSPTTENTDRYGGRADIDLYNQTPTTYGALYLLKDFGGNLQASSFDIDWMSTDLYSTTTVKAPLESEGSTSGGSSPSPSPGASPSPSAVPSAFASLEGVGAFRGVEVATSQVLDDYTDSAVWSAEAHPGLLIGASLVYTPGATNTTWEDEGMDEVGAIYGIISLRGGSNNSAYVEWAEPINWDAYNNTSGNPWSVYVTHGSETDSLEGSYLLYDTTLEIPYLSYKFGYGDPHSGTTNDASGLASYIKSLTAWAIETLAAQIVADEIPNQIINNVIDYGTIKKSQLSTFETTEALQRGIEPTTYTPDPGPS